MILVDSSVWISHLRGLQTPATARLAALVTQEPILVGDLILLEILQGTRNDAHAARIERQLRRFTMVSLLNADLTARAAGNYRALRAQGITVRKTANIIIGTYCIAYAHTLLHEDRDFEPLQTHLGLKVAPQG